MIGISLKHKVCCQNEMYQILKEAKTTENLKLVLALI